MIVKLFVLFLCLYTVLSSNNYCEICPNHTLCKYTMPGPSPSCKKYDNATLLTRDDIVKIVNRINERRHFVAKGLAKLLPQAGNMKRIYWSEELAAFAQRWVDQCDPSTRPDAEDECRNLMDAEVGQNIASVAGPTPGMRIQSLIDVWFTMSLEYKGSVSYYNRSRDWKTNYFTQLIWGDTDRVGCGKARFHVESKNMMIERLVCNFAPKGNIHGKPVYAIGYPATQCQRNTTPDKDFNALCSYSIQNNVREFTANYLPVSSLLRILNLSNNSAKQEIDPVRNNLSQVKLEHNQTNEQRNQKTRHVFLNNSYAAMKNIPPMPMYNKWRNPVNMSRNQRISQYQQERGHSRVYHGHDIHDNNYYRPENKQTPTQNFRKFDYSTEVNSNNENYRKNYPSQECTRSNVQTPVAVVPNNNKNDGTICQSWNSKTNMDTQKQMDYCIPVAPVPVAPVPVPAPYRPPFILPANPPNVCPCLPTTCLPPPPSQCGCNINCRCLKSDCFPTPCQPGFRRNNDANSEASSPSDLHYYDLLPKMAIRSGESDSKRSHSKDVTAPSSWDQWRHSTPMGNIFKTFPHPIQDSKDNVKDLNLHENRNKPGYDYIYDSSDSRERKKRFPADEITFKPFWQMDEFNNQRPGQLKSMKYTTLQKKKTKRTTRLKLPVTTEIITVNIKDNTNSIQLQKHAVTEKFLSFDELMHLRKFGSTEMSAIAMDGRRAGNTKDPSTFAPGQNTTAEYTTNTPFKRKKFCTRKMTCTWTAIAITDANGRVINGGGNSGGGGGSRTPPGYVDGCTRTSTCTRIHMDRNKFSTIPNPDDSTDGDGASHPEDEDYCEKRALNVHRRDSNEETNKDSFTTLSVLINDDDKVTYISSEIFTTPSPTLNCVCSGDNPRIKRNEDDDLVLFDRDTLKHKREKRYNEYLSYGNLYYLVLQKIIHAWKRSHSSNTINPCLCNASGFLIKGSIVLITFMLLYNIILNYFW